MSFKLFYILKNVKHTFFGSKIKNLHPIQTYAKNGKRFISKQLHLDSTKPPKTKKTQIYLPLLRYVLPIKSNLFDKNKIHLKIGLYPNSSLNNEINKSLTFKKDFIRFQQKQKEQVIEPKEKVDKVKLDKQDNKELFHFKSYLNDIQLKNKSLFIDETSLHHNKYKPYSKVTSFNLFKVREAILSFKLKDINPTVSHYYISYPLTAIHSHYFSVIFNNQFFEFNSSPKTFYLRKDQKSLDGLQQLRSIFSAGSISNMLNLLATLIYFGSWRLQLVNDQLRIWFPMPFNQLSITPFLNDIGLKKYQNDYTIGQLPYTEINKQHKVDIPENQDKLVSFINDLGFANNRLVR